MSPRDIIYDILTVGVRYARATPTTSVEQGLAVYKSYGAGFYLHDHRAARTVVCPLNLYANATPELTAPPHWQPVWQMCGTN